jgi:hypothetical protein
MLTRFYRILMVGIRHCNMAEALANIFALQPEPAWGPHLAHWGWGPRVRPVRTHSSYATEILPIHRVNLNRYTVGKLGV